MRFFQKERLKNKEMKAAGIDKSDEKSGQKVVNFFVQSRKENGVKKRLFRSISLIFHIRN